jgi:3-deoxy-D-manno-octulosonic-acid transferase
MSILGDTIGEMGLYLNLTEIAFVGKVPQGRRRTKPSRTCNARLCGAFGQQGREFPRTYARLLRNGGARFVRDGEMLAKGVHYLLSNPQAGRPWRKAGRRPLQ